MEPMWYCHECNAEMRPLMIPDPHCASCRGSFVEKMENLDDDPREFVRGGDDLDDGMPPGIESFMQVLQAMAPPSRRARAPNPSGGNGLSFSFSSSSDSGSRTVRIGGGRTLNDPDTGEPPTIFARRGPEGDGGIAGTLMMQYLMAMMSGGPGRQGGGAPDFLQQMGNPAQQGRMGDYVFNQQALDQIMTQLMDSNAHHPVPAPEEMVQKLPREVLEEGSPTLEKDCAVCKDQFQLATEDPDEQIIVTLPCHHPFHESCITPWLKSSGTCPVCRHALVPQPSQGGPESSSGSGAPQSPPRPTPTPGSGGGASSLFQSIFGGGGNSSGSNPHSPASGPSGSDTPNLPGGWR